MLFNSHIFLLAFLPITWCVYYILRHFKCFKLSLCFLSLASLVFYGYNDFKFALLLVASVVVNYCLYLAFRRISGADSAVLEGSNIGSRADSKRIFLLILGLLYNFGILFYFKYLNFFLTNIGALTGTSFVLKDIVLPLGISFYTFQQVSFIIDCYHGNVPSYKFHEYALFVCFFPQLIAGPIVLHTEMVPQFQNDTRTAPSAADIYEGAQFFIIGLAKKLVIADALGRGVDYGYSNILYLNSLSAVVLILLYTLQIYFDFSGYCDMAIGLGRLFGFRICENFNSPYRSLSVSEFWKRWHMTLTRFFTTYLYIPLGGNRKGYVRTLVNVMIVFLLSGLWHGAAWTFVLWGAMHGIMMVLERIIGHDRLTRIPALLRFIYTFGFVNCAWVFFRAPDFTSALNIFKRILHGGAGYILPGMSEAIFNNTSATVLDHIGLSFLKSPVFISIYATVFILLALYLSIRHKNTQEIVALGITKSFYPVLLGFLFMLSLLSISGVSTFLYFNF